MDEQMKRTFIGFDDEVDFRMALNSVNELIVIYTGLNAVQLEAKTGVVDGVIKTVVTRKRLYDVMDFEELHFSNQVVEDFEEDRVKIEGLVKNCVNSLDDEQVQLLKELQAEMLIATHHKFSGVPNPYILVVKNKEVFPTPLADYLNSITDKYIYFNVVTSLIKMSRCIGGSTKQGGIIEARIDDRHISFYETDELRDDGNDASILKDMDAHIKNFGGSVITINTDDGTTHVLAALIGGRATVPGHRAGISNLAESKSAQLRLQEILNHSTEIDCDTRVTMNGSMLYAGKSLTHRAIDVLADALYSRSNSYSTVSLESRDLDISMSFAQSESGGSQEWLFCSDGEQLEIMPTKLGRILNDLDSIAKG